MTDTTTVEQVLETLAPWPVGNDATPDRLARWFTAQAFASYARLHRHPCWQTAPQYDAEGNPSGAYQQALQGFIRDNELAWAQYVAARLLRDRAGLPEDMPLADALRREQDSAELASETVGDWLVGYGIDPEQILAVLRGPAGITTRGGAR